MGCMSKEQGPTVKSCNDGNSKDEKMLPREAVQSPALVILNAGLDNAFCKLTQFAIFEKGAGLQFRDDLQKMDVCEFMRLD